MSTPGWLHHTAFNHPRQAGNQTMSDDITSRIMAHMSAIWPSAGTFASGGFIPAKQPQEFSGFDTALGEVYGLRAWRIDKYGRLGALHSHAAPKWRPGVNTATCLVTPTLRVTKYDDGRPDEYNVIDPTGAGRTVVSMGLDRKVDADHDYYFGRHITNATTTYAVVWSDGSTETYRDGQLRFTPHAAPDEGCKCGFYAYNDPESDEVFDPGEDYVLGVIKGTGRTMIGTKGFRTEKAEIVALLDPTRGGTKGAKWRGRQRSLLERVYPDVPLIESRRALLEFAPIAPEIPDPTTEEFWSL